MKFLLPLLLAAIVLLFTIGCKKSNSSTSLPEATQTGANTLGCKINGEVFTPKAKLGATSPYGCYYQYINDIYDQGYFFQLSGSDKTKSPIYGIGIYTDSLPIQLGEFDLKNSYAKKGAYGVYNITGGTEDGQYFTTDKMPGKLVITKFDQQKQIVSGTFWFNVINKHGDTIKITDGRFDMKYTR